MNLVRIEESFLAYCLHVTLEKYNQKAATGLSSRSVLERMSEIQMLDLSIPQHRRTSMPVVETY